MKSRVLRFHEKRQQKIEEQKRQKLSKIFQKDNSDDKNEILKREHDLKNNDEFDDKGTNSVTALFQWNDDENEKDKSFIVSSKSEELFLSSLESSTSNKADKIKTRGSVLALTRFCRRQQIDSKTLEKAQKRQLELRRLYQEGIITSKIVIPTENKKNQLPIFEQVEPTLEEQAKRYLKTDGEPNAFLEKFLNWRDDSVDNESLKPEKQVKTELLENSAGSSLQLRLSVDSTDSNFLSSSQNSSSIGDLSSFKLELNTFNFSSNSSPLSSTSLPLSDNICKALLPSCHQSKKKHVLPLFPIENYPTRKSPRMTAKTLNSISPLKSGLQLSEFVGSTVSVKKKSANDNASTLAQNSAKNYDGIKKIRFKKHTDYKAKYQRNLISCMKGSQSVKRGTYPNQRKVFYSMEQTVTHVFNIDEGNTMSHYTEEKVTRKILTTRCTKVLKDKKGLKRIKTKNPQLNLRNNLEKLLTKSRVQKTKSNLSYVVYSRWLITDSVLHQLNEKIFKNVLVTRLEYPDWLITVGLRQLNFDFETSYIFVACGMDWYSAHNPDVNIATNFLRELHCWIKDTLFNKQISRKKTVFKNGIKKKVDSQYFFPIPILVAITIPEVNEQAELQKAYNKNLREFVQSFNEAEKQKIEVANVNQKYVPPIELLDWAKLVSSKTSEFSVKLEPDIISEQTIDVKTSVMKTKNEIEENLENRTKILITEMCDTYGVILH